jgi:hypothetical protein
MKILLIASVMFFLSVSQATAYDATFDLISKVDCELSWYWMKYSAPPFDFLSPSWSFIGDTNCFKQELNGRVTEFEYEGQSLSLKLKVMGCDVEKEFSLRIVAGDNKQLMLTSNNFNDIEKCFSDKGIPVTDIENLHSTVWLDTEDSDRNHLIGFYNNQLYRTHGDGFGTGWPYSDTEDGFFFIDVSILWPWIEVGEYVCDDTCEMKVASYMRLFILPTFDIDNYMLVDDNWSPQEQYMR